ncbi:uncharacterized protein V6R79_013503 [Siganus canaliculatus]
MEFIWLYSLCQGILNVSVIVVSVRLCMAVSGSGTMTNFQDCTRTQISPVSRCLRLCLGWVGAIGGALGVPVTVLLNMRLSQCLYTCITLVCCPMLVRQFSISLFMLLTLDAHLQLRLADRYFLIMSRQRVLCVVFLCWVGSVLSAFGQFIGMDGQNPQGKGKSWPSETGADDLRADHNGTTSAPLLSTFLPPKYYDDIEIIGQYLPYGGFLSKFYAEDVDNVTYAEIHSSHWIVCAQDTILSLRFLVYVQVTTSFIVPFFWLLALYLDLKCSKPRKAPFIHAELLKHVSHHVRSLTLSLSFLVLLCLPLHINHTLMLFTPGTNFPTWLHAVALVLSKLYSFVPLILFTPPKKQLGEQRTSRPLSVPHLPVVPSAGKSVHMALCEAVQAAPWSSAKHSLKAKVCPEV